MNKKNKRFIKINQKSIIIIIVLITILVIFGYFNLTILNKSSLNVTQPINDTTQALGAYSSVNIAQEFTAINNNVEIITFSKWIDKKIYPIQNISVSIREDVLGIPSNIDLCVKSFSNSEYNNLPFDTDINVPCETSLVVGQHYWIVLSTSGEDCCKFATVKAGINNDFDGKFKRYERIGNNWVDNPRVGLKLYFKLFGVN